MDSYINCEMHITLSHDLVNANIPYQLVYETISGSYWNTTKRKKAMAKYFTDEEVKDIETLYQQAYKWYLKTGVPDELELTTKQYALWLKLARFCYELPDFKILDV